MCEQIDLDAPCARCDHSYGDHYTANGGWTGCSADDGYDEYESEPCRCSGFEPVIPPTRLEQLREKLAEGKAKARRWARKHLPFRVQKALGIRRSLLDLEDAVSFLPAIWGRELLDAPLYSTLVNSAYEGEIKGTGDTITVNTEPYRAFAIEDVAAGRAA